MAPTTKAAFTPGPWTFKRCEIGSPDNARNPMVRCSSRTHDGRDIAYIARLSCEESTIPGMTSLAPSLLEAEANARLIAAAPDLLAALVYMRRTMYSDQSEESVMADAAIRKALEQE